MLPFPLPFAGMVVVRSLSASNNNSSSSSSSSDATTVVTVAVEGAGSAEVVEAVARSGGAGEEPQEGPGKRRRLGARRTRAAAPLGFVRVEAEVVEGGEDGGALVFEGLRRRAAAKPEERWLVEVFGREDGERVGEWLALVATLPTVAGVSRSPLTSPTESTQSTTNVGAWLLLRPSSSPTAAEWRGLRIDTPQGPKQVEWLPPTPPFFRLDVVETTTLTAFSARGAHRVGTIASATEFCDVTCVSEEAFPDSAALLAELHEQRKCLTLSAPGAPFPLLLIPQSRALATLRPLGMGEPLARALSAIPSIEI